MAARPQCLWAKGTLGTYHYVRTENLAENMEKALLRCGVPNEKVQVAIEQLSRDRENVTASSTPNAQISDEDRILISDAYQEDIALLDTL